MARGFNLTAELNLRGPSNIRTVVADIRRQLGTINADVNVRVDPNVTRNITTLNQTFRNFTNTLQATNASANATALSLRNLGTAIQQVNNSAANLPANLQQINAATRNVVQQNAAASAAVHNTTSAFMEFGRQSALAARRFAAISTVTAVIYKVSNALTSATTDFIAFNQELVRVSQVTDTSVKNLGGLVGEITELSTKFGVSSNELIKVSSTLAQAGLSARDTEKALKALALSALAPSFDNLNSTVEGSIALMRQFGISAGELDSALGSVNAVAAKFAVEAGDIITAIQRTGGVFATASKGVSEGTQALNEFMAVFTSVRATTRESAETIATGLRTIFTRIQRGDTIDALKEYGVTLTDLQGKFVGPYEAVRRLSEGLSQLDPRDLKFSRIVEELGGFRQIGKVIPLIQQFATAQAALKVAQSGQDSLAIDAATAQQSLAVQMAKVRNEFVGLVRSIGQSSGFQSFVKLSLDLTSNLIRLTDAAKGALPALGAIFAMRGLSALGQFGRGFIGGIRPTRNNQGGQIRAFAAGGHVPGSGDGDTVPAMLTPGEFVLRKSAVRSIGVGNLHRINRHAGGGKVGPVSIQKLPQAVSLISQNPKIARYMNVNEDSASGFIKQIEPWMLGLNVKSIAREIYNDMRKGLPISPTNQRFSLGKNKATPTQMQSYSNLLGRRGSDKSPKDFLAGKEGARRISQLGTADESPKWSEAYERLLSRTIKERVGKQYIPTGEIENIPRRNSYPVDLISADGKSVGEVKFRPSGMVSKTDYLDKLLRARVVRNLTRPFTLSSPESKDIGNINVYEMPNKDLVMNEIRDLYAKNQGKNNRASGGFIRKFANAGLVTPTAGTTATSSEILKVLTLQGAMQASGANAGDILKILKKKNALSPQEKSIKDQILAAYTKKTSGIKAANDLDIQKATTEGLLFGAAGFKGKAFATTPRMDIPGLNNPVKVRITSGVLDKNAAGRDIKRMAQAMSGESQNLTKNVMIRDILKQVGPIYSDFDRTLAFGADKILSDPRKPRFSEFSDKTKVERALAKATLSKLGKALVSQVKKTPELLDNLHVISARPQATMGLIATWLAKNGLPIPIDRIKGVGGPDRTAEQIAELKLKEMDKSGSFIDDDERNINAAKAAGINTYLYKNKKVKSSDRKKMGEANAQGYMAESIIHQLGGPIANKAATNYGIDFPDGLQDAAKYFNLPQNIPTDAKLTLNGPAELKDQIGNYLKARGYASGGHVQAMVSNGEAYVPPETAKAIGYGKLNRMNQADRNGMSSFSSGGISVFKGSGTGTSDSIGPINLPVGSFILREAATKALGYRSGGAVRGIQRFAGGGTTYEAVASFDAVSAQAEKAVDDLLAKIVNQIATANPSVDFDTAYRSAEDQVVGGVSLGTRQAADLGDQNAAKAVADAQRKQVASLTRQIRATDSSVSVSMAKAAAERKVADAWGGLYKAVQTNTQSQSRLAQSFPTLSKAFQGASRGLGSIRSRIMGPSDEEIGNMSDSQRAQYEAKRDRRARYMNGGLALAFAAPMAAEAVGSMVGGSNGRGVAAAGTAFGGAVSVGAQFGPWGALAGAVAGAVLAVDSFGKAVAEADIDVSKKKIEGSATNAEAQLEKLNKNPKDAAITSSIIQNFKSIAAEEEKISAKQAELRQPSYLTRGLEAASFGMYKAAKPTDKQIAEEETANQKVAGEIALKTITAKVEGGSNIQEALSSFGGDKDLAKLNIAQTNEKFNLENKKLENIKKTPGQDPQIIADVEKRQKELIDVYFKEETATLQATVAERSRVQALQQSARTLNLASVSISKTFENMDQAIAAATMGLDKASQRIDEIASGQASLKTEFKSKDVLKNPNAYSQKERQTAISQVSGMFGTDKKFVEGLSKFGSSAEDTITKIAVKAQQSGNGSSETLGDDITRELTQQLIDTFGDNRISDAIREQLKGAVKDNIKQNDGVLDPQSLIESTGGLKQLIDSQKKSFNTMLGQYEFIEKGLNQYGEAVQKAAELQTQAIGKFASLQGYLSDSTVSLKEALGEGRRISLKERASGRYTEAAINAGIKPGSLTAANLTNQRTMLMGQQAAVQGNISKLENSGNAADPAVISLINKQKEALANLNRQIAATEKGLETLPDLIKQDMQDTLSKISQLRSEKESKTQAGASFGEKLVTSTPTELKNLNSTYDLLNRTLNGQITTINQSISAQQAYQKVIEDGGTHMDAVGAAQEAFASDAKNTFGLFNELITVSGLDNTDPQRAGNLRADLIENTARNQGLNVQNNPFLREIVANLRAAPKEDPQIKALENLYKQQQAALGEATQKAINPLLEKQAQILNTANTALITALTNLTNAFNNAQGRNEGLGLARPGNVMTRAQGGPVYAASGTLVNYEPRGTDTVPAMLTPGEFVVNRSATQNNLPLLKSINSGKYAKGGVVYLAGGSTNPVQIANVIDPLVANMISGSDDAGDALNIIARGNRYRVPSNLSPRDPLFKFLLARQGDPAMTGARVRREWNAAVRASRLGINDPIFKPYIQQITEVKLAGLDLGDNDIPEIRRPRNVNPNGLERWLGIQPVKPKPPASLLNRTGNMLGSAYQGARSVIRNPGAALSYGASQAPGIARAAAPIAGRFFGSIFGAVSGAMADPRLTNRNRLVNTGLGMLTGTGETMGDVGAHSMIGWATGVEQGTMLDRQLGNFSQLGLTSVEHATMGVPAQFAPITAALAMNIQETAGYLADANDATTSEIRTNRNLQASRRPRRPNDHLGGFDLNAFQRSAVERKAELLRLKKKDQAARGNSQGTSSNQNFYDEQIRLIDDSFNTMDTVPGIFWDTKQDKNRGTGASSARLDAATEAHVQYLDEQERKSELAAEQKRAEKAKKVERQRQEERRQTRATQVRATANRAVQTAVPYVSSVANAAVSGFQTINRNNQENINRRRAANESQADRWVDRPALPPGAAKVAFDGDTVDVYKQTDKLNKEKQEIEAEIDRYKYKDPKDMSKEQKRDKEKLLQQLEDKNRQIVSLNNKAFVDIPLAEQDRLWKNYEKKQEREANRAQILASNRANSRRFNLELAVGKAVGMGAPDKFRSPEAFMGWREQALSKLRGKFNLSGSPRLDEKLLTKYGLSADAAKDLFRPFTPEQAEALIQTMSQQTVGGNYKYSDRDIAILRMSQDQIEQVAFRIYNKSGDYGADVATMAERKRLEKAQGKTFAKLLRNFSSIDRMAARGQGMNPGQQAMLKNNISKQLTKMGYINPEDTDAANAARLSAFNINNTVGLLYPRVAAGNPAFRVAQGSSNGGMIYAADGTLVDYQPRGTDTVPAMLTPGEFVVNAKATSQHLPLLQAINKSKGGVIYRSVGGETKTLDSTQQSSQIRDKELNSRLQQEIANNAKNNLGLSTKISDTTKNTKDQQLPKLVNNTDTINRNNLTRFDKVDVTEQRLLKNTDDLKKQNKTNLSQTSDSLGYMMDRDSTHYELSTAHFALSNRMDAKLDRLLLLAAAPPMIPPAPPAGAQNGPPLPGAPPGAGNLPVNPGGAGAQFSKGGIVYASAGKLINYQPKGTDTVPAMLTPGEFVVNAKATSQNLPLLQAINKDKGGVIYAEKGKHIPSQDLSFEDVALGKGLPAKFSPRTPAYGSKAELDKAVAEGYNAAISNDEELKSQPLGKLDHLQYRRAFPYVERHKLDTKIRTHYQPPFDTRFSGSLMGKEGQEVIHVDPKKGSYGLLMHEMRHAAFGSTDESQRSETFMTNEDLDWAVQVYNAKYPNNPISMSRAEYLTRPFEIDARLGAVRQIMKRHQQALVSANKPVPYKTVEQAYHYFLANRNSLNRSEDSGFATEDLDFYTMFKDKYETMMAMRMAELYSNGGVVYAQDGRQINKPSLEDIRAQRKADYENEKLRRKQVAGIKRKDKQSNKAKLTPEQIEKARQEARIASILKNWGNPEESSQLRNSRQYWNEYGNYSDAVGGSPAVNFRTWMKENYPGVKGDRLEKMIKDFDPEDANATTYSKGGIIYAHEGTLVPRIMDPRLGQQNQSDMPEMTPTQGELDWARRQQQAHVANRDAEGFDWNAPEGVISAYGPPPGPGPLGAPFHERMNMFSDIVGSFLFGLPGAGPKPSPQTRVPRAKTPLLKQPVVLPAPRPERAPLGFEDLGTRGAANPKAGGVKGTGLTSTDTQATAQVFDPSKTMSQSRTLAEYQKSLKDARDIEFKRLEKLKTQWAKEQLAEYQKQEKEGTLRPDTKSRNQQGLPVYRSLEERADEIASYRVRSHQQTLDAAYTSAKNSSEYDFASNRTVDTNKITGASSFIKPQAKPTFSKFIETKDFDIDSIQRLIQYPQPVFDSLVETLYQLTGTSGELPKTFNRTNLLFGDQEIGITGIGAKAPGVAQQPVGRMGVRDTIGRENIQTALKEVLLSNFRSEMGKFERVNLGPVDEMNASRYKDRGLIGTAEQKVGGTYGAKVEGTGNFYQPESESAAAEFLSRHTNFNLTQADTDPKLAQSRGGFLIETARGVLEDAKQKVMIKLQQSLLAQQNKPQTPDVPGAPASNKIRILSPYDNTNADKFNSEVFGEDAREIIAFYEDPKTGSANQGWGRVSAKPIDNQKTFKIETSLAKKGYGESLYHAIIEYITKIGGSVIPDDSQTPDAKKLWKKLEKHPDISAGENGYTKKPSLITDTTRVESGVGEDYIRRPTTSYEIEQQGYGDLVKPVSPTPVTPIPSSKAKAFGQFKSQGGIVYAQNGVLVPGSRLMDPRLGQQNQNYMPEMTPTQGELDFANQQAKLQTQRAKITTDNSGRQWHTPTGEISAYGPPAGPGLLGASFLERAGAAWNMFTDIAEAAVAGGATTTNAGSRQSIRGAKTPITKSSAPLDVPKASKTVPLFHASNTGLEDSILKSFQKEGGKSSIAKGYGQGQGLYTYTSREAAEKHARSIMQGTLTGADTRGKPMIVKFDETLDPSRFDLDYELNKSYVARWLHDNFDQVQSVLSDMKYSPLLKKLELQDPSGKTLRGIQTQTFASPNSGGGGLADSWLMQQQTRLPSRRAIYDSTDAVTRDGEVLSQIMKFIGKRNPEMLQKFREGFFETMPPGSAIKYIGSDNLAPSNIDVLAKARGGVVYANNGMLIPYQPRGTDTVPAMLTPGEFVVNRQATQQNLPLLKSINSGAQGFSSGGVVYLESGGETPKKRKYTQDRDERRQLDQLRLAAIEAERKQTRDSIEAERKALGERVKEAQINKAEEYKYRGIPRQIQQAPPQGNQTNQQNQQQNQAMFTQGNQQMNPQMSQRVNMAAQAAFDPQHAGDVDKQLAIFGTLLTGSNQVLTQFGMALENMIQSMGATPVGGGVNNNSRGQLDGLSQFTSTFNRFIGQLEQIKIPEQVNLQGTHRVEVVINGASVFANMQEPIQRMILDQVNGAMNKLAMKTEGVLQV